jgi:hypothetical protein
LFRRDPIAGNALQDLGNGGENGAAILERGQLEVGPTPAISLLLGEAAGGVMVVAEGLVAQRWAAAAVAVDEDVAALEAPGRFWLCGCFGLRGWWCGDLVRHDVVPPWWTLSPKVFKRKGLPLDFEADPFGGRRCFWCADRKSPASAPSLLFTLFVNDSRWEELVCQGYVIDFDWVMGFGGLTGFWGYPPLL